MTPVKTSHMDAIISTCRTQHCRPESNYFSGASNGISIAPFNGASNQTSLTYAVEGHQSNLGNPRYWGHQSHRGESGRKILGPCIFNCSILSSSRSGLSKNPLPLQSISIYIQLHLTLHCVANLCRKAHLIVLRWCGVDTRRDLVLAWSRLEIARVLFSRNCRRAGDNPSPYFLPSRS
jgi:hypothetical protein